MGRILIQVDKLVWYGIDGQLILSWASSCAVEIKHIHLRSVGLSLGFDRILSSCLIVPYRVSIIG